MSRHLCYGCGKIITNSDDGGAPVSQMERIFFIDRTIQERGGVNVREIAATFEVSERQAKRDIEYLRYRLGAPVEWSAPKRQYIYSAPWDGLKFASEKSLFALAFFRAILDRYSYIPVLSEELIDELKRKIGARYASIAEHVRYELPDLQPISDDISYRICRSLLEQHNLRITYRDAHDVESERTIVPLRLINYAGKWYCAAYDSLSGKLRVFAIARIKEAYEAEPSHFPLPGDDEIERFLSSSYGIFKGDPVGTATLQFRNGAARAIRDQIWHPDQVLTISDNNAGDEYTVDLSLPVHDWTELLGRALRCGADCEVLGPQEFRERWVEEIERMAEMAGKGD